MSDAREVIVVGAGPVGLTAACELSRHGAAVRVIERSAWPGVRSRAMLIDTRTLEILEDIGVLDDALSTGHRIYGASLYDDGRRVAFVSFEDPDAPFPFVLSLPQSATEALLERALSMRGLHVERGVECVDVKASPDEVDLELRRINDGGVTRVRTPWLVACDGAHSSIRDQQGVEFARDEPEQAFAIVDVKARWSFARDELHAFASADGIVVAFPLPGDDRWRLVMNLDEVAVSDERPSGGLTLVPIQSIAPARVHDCLKRRAQAIPESLEIEWSASYRIRPRVAQRYSQRRVMLVGDAAHVFSPASSQGMNVGMQDAQNLGWKLALVHRGLARESLLDSYHAERQPVALGILDPRTYPVDLLPLRAQVGDVTRRHMASLLSALDVMQRRLARHSPWHAASYRASPSVSDPRSSSASAGGSSRTGDGENATFAGAPLAGDRAPDAFVTNVNGDLRRIARVSRDTRHTALLFSGTRPQAPTLEMLRSVDARLRVRVPSAMKSIVVLPPEAARHAEYFGGEVLIDPDLDAHRRYAAGLATACVVRPDGYLGLCARPMQVESVNGWLEMIFR